MLPVEVQPAARLPASRRASDRAASSANSPSNEPTFSFQSGLHQLIDRLLEKACPELLCNTTIDAPIWKDQTILLPLSSGNTLAVDALIFALPFSSLGELLPPLRPLLEVTPFASVAMIHYGYSQKVLQTPGFGYLVPFEPGNPVLGVTFDSCFFPQHNKESQERITVMMGGMRHPNTLDLSDAELFAIAERALRQEDLAQR